MHNANTKEKEMLISCLQLIEDRLAWPDPSEWRHSHFELLSEKIFEETSVQLSAVTLKRIWGKVSYHSFPSITTLDVLARFAGYPGWIDFQAEYEQLVSGPQVKQLIASNSPVDQLLRKPAIIFSLTAIALFGILIAMADRSPKLIYKNIKFDFEPVTSGVPNTVIFSYNAAESNADSVFIQQSWNPDLRHEVDKNQHTFTTTYYFPGYFSAKLLLNEEIVVEKDLYVKSGGWLATIDLDDYRMPHYLPYEEIHQEGKIAVSPEQITEKGLDLKKQIPYTKFHMVDDWGEMSAWDFQLSTEFRHTLAIGDAVCQYFRLLILCSNSVLIVPFSIKGCVGELNLFLAGEFIDGQTADLSGFGVDYADWVGLDVKVTDGDMEIFVNNKPVFTHTLTNDPGKIAGVRYQFYGTGEVNSLLLQSNNNIHFEDNFQ